MTMESSMSNSDSEDSSKKYQRTLRPMSNERYSTICELLKGTFAVPKKYVQRCKKQPFDNFNGQRKSFTDNLGCGSRALKGILAQQYSGISERRINRVIQNSKTHQQLFARFTNKATPKSVTASQVGERWQLDLIDMSKEPIRHDGLVYKYILSVLDVFSRCIIVRPLVSKSADDVAKELKPIILEHGAPSIVQCDNGNEFKGKVGKLLAQKSCKVIHGRPYHPQSQGKCERSHRTLKQKLRYCGKRGARGCNWAKSLHKVAQMCNNSPKQVLNNKTPYEVYFMRPKTGLSRDTNAQIRRSLITKQVRRATERLAALAAARFKRSYKASTYSTGETVYIRYPYTGSRIPRRRFVLKGKILKRNLGLERYKVQFKKPDGKVVKTWISVEFITSLTLAEEKKKSKLVAKTQSQTSRQIHREQYYMPFTQSERLQNLDLFGDGSISIGFNPEGNGDCQFASFGHQLSKLGIYRTANALRNEAADHLAQFSCSYRSFVDEDYESYSKSMASENRYGDHLKLLSLCRQYNLQCMVVSADSIDHTCLISPTGVFEHYVSLSISRDAMQKLIEDVCQAPYIYPTSSEGLSEESRETLTTLHFCENSKIPPVQNDDRRGVAKTYNLRKNPKPRRSASYSYARLSRKTGAKTKNKPQINDLPVELLEEILQERVLCDGDQAYLRLSLVFKKWNTICGDNIFRQTCLFRWLLSIQPN